MANIPKPENDDSLELNVRYQPDMVLEGMLDATVPEFTQLTLTMGDDVYDLTGGGLPDYSEANDGDALIIEDGEPTWGAVDGLPEIEESDEGKVLAVDQGEAVWADAPSGLPEITNSDEGKVLTVVDNSGTLEAEWAEPSGGGLVLTPVEDPENPSKYTFTGTTPLEVATAFNNGVPCYIHIAISEYGSPSFDSVWRIDACLPNNKLQLAYCENEDIVLSATQIGVSEDNGTNYVTLTTFMWEYDVDALCYRLRRISTLLTGTSD